MKNLILCALTLAASTGWALQAPKKAEPRNCVSTNRSLDPNDDSKQLKFCVGDRVLYKGWVEHAPATIVGVRPKEGKLLLKFADDTQEWHSATRLSLELKASDPSIERLQIFSLSPLHPGDLVLPLYHDAELSNTPWVVHRVYLSPDNSLRVEIIQCTTGKAAWIQIENFKLQGVQKLVNQKVLCPAAEAMGVRGDE